MVRVVGVRFKKAGKVYYFDPADYPIEAGAKVVVETARGVEYGEVAVGPKQVEPDQVVQPLKKVLRVGTEKDASTAAENKRKEREAYSVAQKKIEAHSLEMNLVDVEYTFDGSKIIFYFTAEGRVDFRELVRDLASVFRARIEMRQIGVRDEAKLLGGIGPCGRILCCTSFLGDFAPVSIRMAKDQNLSLNPSKISGLCGRLMCCLRYEQDTYEAAKKDPTLSPSYVPPTIDSADDDGDLDQLDDQPGIRPVIRSGFDSGLSARIAQATSLLDRPVRQPDRGEERRGAPDRNPRPTHQGPRPKGPERQQGATGATMPATGRPQGDSAAQPHNPDRRPAPQGTNQGGPKAQTSPESNAGEPGARPQTQPERDPQRQDRPEAGRDQNRHRHHRNHRRGDKDKGATTPQE